MDNNPTPYKSFFKSILFFILAGLTLIIISGLIGYFLAKKTNVKSINRLDISQNAPPTQVPTDETENWKTYTNNQYGLEFKYPTNWHLRDTLPEGDIGLEPITSLGIYTMRIEVEDNENKLSSKDYTNKIISDAKQYTGPGGLIFDSQEEIILAGQPAIKLIGVFAYDENLERIFIAKNNIVFSIDYPVKSDNQNLFEPKKNYEVVQKILSTFKFLDLKKEIVLITQELLDKGWYYDSHDHKLSGTPSDWIYQKSNGGGTNCWHKPNVNCY